MLIDHSSSWPVVGPSFDGWIGCFFLNCAGENDLKEDLKSCQTKRNDHLQKT